MLKTVLKCVALKFPLQTYNNLKEKSTATKLMTYLKLNSHLMLELRLGNSLHARKLEKELRHRATAVKGELLRQRGEQLLSGTAAVPAVTITDDNGAEQAEQLFKPYVVDVDDKNGHEESDVTFESTNFSDWCKKFESKRFVWIRLMNVNLPDFELFVNSLVRGKSRSSLQSLELLDCKISLANEASIEALAELELQNLS